MGRTTALALFVIYTLIWEGIVWGGGMWVILTQGWSPWWVLALLFISSAQFKPQAFLAFTDKASTPE